MMKRKGLYVIRISKGNIFNLGKKYTLNFNLIEQRFIEIFFRTKKH
jgi:hypothetical protein